MYLNKIRNIFCLFYILLTPIDVWSAIPSLPTTDIEIHFHSGAKVRGEKVVLGDVATIYARSLQDFEVLSKLTLSSFPSDKNNMRIPASYIETRVKEALGHKAVKMQQLSEFIDFQRAADVLSAEEVIARIYDMALKKKKVPDGIKITVEIPSLPHLPATPNFEIVAVGERSFWRGENTFKITINGEHAWVKCKIYWNANAWVAKKEIKFLQNLTAEDFEQKNVDVTYSVEMPIIVENFQELSEKLSGTRSKRSLKEKMFLTNSMIDKKPDLSAGQQLKVVFIADSGLRVTAEGAAINDAVVGDNAKVRLKKSKKIVIGRVINTNLIEVSL